MVFGSQCEPCQKCGLSNRSLEVDQHALQERLEAQRFESAGVRTVMLIPSVLKRAINFQQELRTCGGFDLRADM